MNKKRLKRLIALVAVAVMLAVAFCYVARSYQYYRWMANVVLVTNGYEYDTKKRSEVLKEMHPNALSQWFFKKSVAKMVENNASHTEINRVIGAVFKWGLSSFSGRPCGVDMWTKDPDQQVLMKLIDLDRKYRIEAKYPPHWIYEKMPDGSLRVGFEVVYSD